MLVRLLFQVLIVDQHDQELFLAAPILRYALLNQSIC